jgi:hypothetical protein
MACLIALGAFALRWSFTNFPTDRHSDEPVIARLAQQASHNGKFTANWVGAKEGIYWDRPTYQFSPYTLITECIHWGWYRVLPSLASQDQHIMLARRTSCLWGGLAVLLMYPTMRRGFGSIAAAFLGQGVLALAPVHVVDSLYARVDTFVCLLVVACFYLAIRSHRSAGPWMWLLAVATGVTVAAKYNAAPIVLLNLWPALAGWRQGSGARRAFVNLLAVMAVVVAGFVLATPELLRDPQPLWDGVRFELDHYQHGHMPFQAFGWEDNNLLYWANYLAFLGFGLVPMCAAIISFVATIRRPSTERVLLLAYVLVTSVMVLMTRVRFERNLEILTGPLAMSAGLGVVELLARIRRPHGLVLRTALVSGILVLLFSQQTRTLIDLHEAIDPKNSPWAMAYERAKPGRRFMADLMDDPALKAQALRYGQVYLSDYNDPFSAAGLKRWLEFLGPCRVSVFQSKWAARGYPFSTLDVTFGPARLYYVERTPSGPQEKHEHR